MSSSLDVPSVSSSVDSATTAPLAAARCTQVHREPTDNSGSETRSYGYDGRPRLNCTYDFLDRAPEREAGLTGQRVESALGLTYAKRRWLDSSTGTWLSRDDVGAASYLQSPNELNPWQYAAGNPTRFTDPDGREVDCQTLARGNSQFDYGACMRGRMANARPRVEPAKPAFEVTGPSAVPVAAGVKLATELEKLGAAAGANPGAAALGTMKMTPMYQLSPWGVQDMVSGTKESFERAGKNLGGLGACWEGDWWTCGETAPFGFVEGAVLIEGGRSVAGELASAGALKGGVFEDLALDVNRQTLNPKNWKLEFYSPSEAVGSGPPIKKLSYVGPKVSPGPNWVNPLTDPLAQETLALRRRSLRETGFIQEERNAAAIEFVDPSSNAVRRHAVFSDGPLSHSERLLVEYVKKELGAAYDPKHIKRLYTELSPCGGCGRMISKEIPGVPVHFSWDYPVQNMDRMKILRTLFFGTPFQ